MFYSRGEGCAPDRAQTIWSVTGSAMFSEVLSVAMEFARWFSMLSVQASMAVLLVLCAYERQGTTAVVAESVCSITPDAKARKTPSDTSETSAPVDEKFAAEGATLEKNQTQSIDTSVAPMVQNDKVADTDSQARSHTADNFEDAVKQKEKLSKEITQGNSL
ncbi:unnamed protein product [Toxocara canis]|uniref:Secreted protein n=1 Tax=Toxocara canis TaxID=6265 RepID=A0A183UIX7_TOXCA|nr:unnamed protein product [Toxocara canis]